jgi:translation elongation factor EF-Tu-like GTPase
MGCLLRGVKREQVRRGQVIAAPGSIKAVKKFQAQIYVNDFPFTHRHQTDVSNVPGSNER